MATLPPTPLSMNPEEPMLEYDTSSHPFRQDLIGGAIGMSDGKVKRSHKTPASASRWIVTCSGVTAAVYPSPGPQVLARARNGSRKGPTNAFTRAVRDLVLPFFLKTCVNAEKAYSYNAWCDSGFQ